MTKLRGLTPTDSGFDSGQKKNISLIPEISRQVLKSTQRATRSVQVVKIIWRTKLTIHIQLMPNLRMRGVIPPPYFFHGVSLLIMSRKNRTFAVIDTYLWNLGVGGGGEATRNVVFSFGGRGMFQAADSTELMNHVWLNWECEGESSVHILQGNMPRLACAKRQVCCLILTQLNRLYAQKP